MTGKKIAEEIAPVLTLNSTSFVVSLTDLELILKILLLVVSIVYTLERFMYYKRKKK